MPKKTKTNNQAVTSKEFNEITKEFIERFEQVDERFDKIENKMATKDDLKKFATKDDIKSIKEVISNIATKIINNLEDFKSIKETMATKDDIRSLKTDIDGFAGKTKDHEHKAVLNTERIKEIEPKVEDHDYA